jgi:alpha-beta hydrolase superfamily lysophospholipase
VPDAMTLAATLRANGRHETADAVEEPEMIGPVGEQLFTVRVTPTTRAVRATGLVICHSYFEMKFFQRVELGLLRSAAARGFAGIYVSAPGWGDSEGDQLACTVATRVAAARAAAAALRDRQPTIERVCFVGARMGAAIALLAADHDAAPVALWDPALDGEEYWRHTRRFARVSAAISRRRTLDPDAALERDDRVVVVDHAIDRALRADLASIDAALALAPNPSPAFVAALNDALLRSSRTTLRGVLPDLDGVSLGLPKLRHVIHLRVGEAEDAVGATVDWLDRRLP